MTARKMYLFIALIAPLKAAFPPSLRYPLPITTNKIENVHISCDKQSLNISLDLQDAFKGMVFAKDFSQECKAIGSLSNSVSISLPTSGCGVRLSSKLDESGMEQMFYSVVLVLQQDRYLRQIADQEKYVECKVDRKTFVVKSQPLLEFIKDDLKQKNKGFRIGRMQSEDFNEALSAARAWMEIVPEYPDTKSQLDTLQVGETAVLTIKSTLPTGIGWKVVDCIAHDGLGDSSQKLLDENGCAVDELLLPTPQIGKTIPIASMLHQEAISKFAAFKFPDRDRLHLVCGLQLCRGSCSEMDCTNETNSENRLARTLTDAKEGDILDRLEIFNSVEVVAPAIDDLRKSDNFQYNEPQTYPFTNLPGDRTFCVSPDKIAITFCILGVIFLCAVIISACALLRARRSNCEGPFYTRSLFSSSSSGSGFGSKLLVQENPCLGQPPPRGMHYGRIL